ncbi:DMT family transporter [uncultured Treponema sp.]|uniref:DMT family transporter n=1 Tax=uncultured Treponema sp. TaxID=162155 RepID=UPI0025FC8F3F|nr:DMT family transporter [uncultured Treponema sp.]
MNKKSVSLLSASGLLLAAAVWGFAFVIVKDSLDYIGAVWMLAFRFTIAAFALALLYCKKLKMLTRRAWIHGGILGFYLFTAYLVQTIGCKYTTAGKNAFLTTIYVFFVPLFLWIQTKKRPAWYVFVCALMSITGIGLLALGTSDGGNVNIGDVLTLICGIFYALHIIFTAKYNEEHDPILLTVLQFLFASIFSWICAPLFDGRFPLEQIQNPRVIVSMLYLGLFSTMLAFVLQNVGLKYLPSALASLLLSFESVFGVIFSTIVLGEKLTLRMGAGCTLIFAAVVLAQTLPEILKKGLDEKPSSTEN